MLGLIGSLTLDNASDFGAPLESRQSSSNFVGDWLSRDGLCSLGHTRQLSNNGNPNLLQPITSHCGRFTLAFHGQIYNHEQVRSGLRYKYWVTNSDSETLVEGLAQRGLALLLELRGMFAFAAYDSQKCQLLLARDRLGIKPLYLSWQPRMLFFSSERHLLPGANSLSVSTISNLLCFGYNFTPSEFSKSRSSEVLSLPPGTAVRINTGRPHDPVRYWPPQPRPDWSPLPIHSRHKSYEFIRQQLEEVLVRHFQGHQQVACYVNNDIGSKIVTALACRSFPGSTSSFHVGLKESGNTTNSIVHKFANQCKADHNEVVINSDQALEWVDQAITTLDIPTPNSIQTFLVSNAISHQGVKSVFFGVGADDLFGSSSSHRVARLLMFLRFIPRDLRKIVLHLINPSLERKLNALVTWDVWYLLLAIRRLRFDDSLHSAGLPSLSWPSPFPQRITQVFGQASYSELFGITEPLLLGDFDAMQGFCDLKWNLPFLDHHLVEIALRTPKRFQSHTHGLLYSAYSDLFPYLDCNNLSRDLFLPMSTWMTGPLRQMCLDRISCLRQTMIFSPSWVDYQWRSFEAGQLGWRDAWNLVLVGELVRRSDSK